MAFTNGITPPVSTFAEGITPPASVVAACGAAPSSIWESCIDGATTAPPILDPIAGSVEMNTLATVTLTGENFTPESVVAITGVTILSTTYVSATELSVDIDADGATAGTHATTVTTITGTSNAQDLTIAEAVPPVAETTPGALRLWLESDFGIRDAGGAALTTWRDRSGFNNHLTRASGYTAPTYRSTGFPGGNAPYVEFNDVHGLESALAASLDTLDFAMIVELFREPGDSNSAFFYMISDTIALGVQDSAASSYLSRWNTIAKSSLRESSYHTAIGWVPVNARQRLRVVWDGATHAGHKQYRNGVLQAIASQLNTIALPMISSGSALVRLGFRDSSLPQFNLQGKIKACIVISPKPSDADLTAWETYLATK